MAIFGDRVLRCSDGHLFVSGEGERLFGSIHLGWWRMMQCPVDGRFRVCGNVRESSLTPEQLDELRRYRQSPAPAPSTVAAPAPMASPAEDEAHRLQALAKLEELLDGGALTPEEFEAEKRRILNR
jgi:putative oligomerization/nucleic acid binding protein